MVLYLKLADTVSKMIIFQRSPNWIVPKPDRLYNSLERFCLRYVPLYARMYRFYWYFLQERNYLAFYQKHNFFTKFIERAISAILTRFKLFDFEKVYTAGSLMLIDEQIEDEEFKKKLGNKNIHTAESIEESLLMNNKDENCIFLCAGSLYLAGEVLNLN